MQLPSVNEVESLLWVAYPPGGGFTHTMCQQSSTGLRLEGVCLFTLVVVWTDEVFEVDTGPWCEWVRCYCEGRGCVSPSEEFAKAVLTEGPPGCSREHLHMWYSSRWSMILTQFNFLNKKHKMWINAIISYTSPFPCCHWILNTYQYTYPYKYYPVLLMCLEPLHFYITKKTIFRDRCVIFFIYFGIKEQVLGRKIF